MNSRVEAVANEAVFVLQFNSREAVRYIQRNAKTDEPTARQALKLVTTGYKNDPWKYVTV